MPPSLPSVENLMRVVVAKLLAWVNGFTGGFRGGCYVQRHLERVLFGIAPFEWLPRFGSILTSFEISKA